MLRFLALTWSRADAGQCSAAEEVTRRVTSRLSDLRNILDRQDIRVFCAGTRPGVTDLYVLADSGGIVLGTLFEQSVGTAVDGRIYQKSNPSIEDGAAIVASQGRTLIERYWGSYVAFLRDPSGRASWIIRSPMDAPPCFHMKFRGLSIFFSSMEDLVRLALRRFSINWNYLAAHVVFGRPEGTDTALGGVSQVHAGECVEVRGEKLSRRLCWNPCSIAGTDVIENPSDAIEALRSATRACVHAWASCHSHVLHRLSGGIDSSIVLACLSSAATRPDITAVHYHSGGPFGDERAFARLAARRAGCELIERVSDREIRLEGILGISRSPIPSIPFGYLEHAQPEAQLAHDKGATAVFWGDLGDALFHHAPAMPAGVEFMERHGFRLRLLKIAFHVAQLESVSIWKALSTAIQESRLSAHRGLWTPYALWKDDHLQTDSATDVFENNLASFIHPWLRATANVPAGKLWQIFLLPYDLSWRNPFARADDPKITAPLVSQPLAETCLRIPTYLNVSDGWDRAIARQAFARDLPREIATRVSKGSPDDHVREVIARNAGFIRELLLDGVAVREGLLDRRKLEAALPGAPTKSPCPVGLIMEHLCTEAWLRSWTETSYETVA